MTLAAATVVLLTLTVMAVALFQTERDQINAVLKERLVATAYGASTAIDGDSLISLGRSDRMTVAWVIAQTTVRLFWRDSSGAAGASDGLGLVALGGGSPRLVAHSQWSMNRPPVPRPVWNPPPALADSVENIVAGRNPVFWFITGEHFLAIAPIYRSATIPAGYAVASLPRGIVRQELLGRLVRLAAFPLLALGSALVLAFFLSGRLTRRIKALADHARTVAGGDLSHDLNVTTGDEVASLAGALQQMTIRLRAMLREAEVNARTEAIGRLAGTVAHDFNNILTVIRVTTEFVREQLPKNHVVQDDIDEIAGAANRAAELTTQLLVFSRERVLPAANIDLNDTIERSAGMLRRLAGPKVIFTSILEPATLTIAMEPGQLDRVLVNLVVNARDAMPNGGTLELQTESEVFGPGNPPPADTILKNGAYAVMRVTDSGSGMTAETMARVFEPFFTTKAPGKGTGLGLASVRVIVHQCDGDITVASRLGQGTTFTVYLPLESEAAASVQTRDPMQTLVVGSETILLVEDEEGVRSVAKRILEKRGYSVLAARHAEDAMMIHGKFTGVIDLLLTDLMMPGMDGCQLAIELQRRHPGLPVLFMSGYADRAIFGGQRLDESQHFLRKPFTAESLTFAVRAAIHAGVPPCGALSPESR